MAKDSKVERVTLKDNKYMLEKFMEQNPSARAETVQALKAVEEQIDMYGEDADANEVSMQDNQGERILYILTKEMAKKLLKKKKQ